MDWYRHKSNSHNDPLIVDLMVRFKSDGYVVWFVTLEILSAEDSMDRPAVIPEHYLARNMNLDIEKIKTILSYIQTKGKLKVEFLKNEISIFCPNLKRYRDEYSKRKAREKRRKKAVQTPVNNRIEAGLKQSKTETEQIQNITKENKPLAPVGAGYNFFKIFFDKYLEHRKEKYTSFSEKKEAGLLKNICKKITQVEYELALDRFHALSDNFVKGNGYNVVAFTTKLQGLLSNNYTTPAKDITPERDYK